MPKPETSLEGTKTLAAIREIVEDRLADVVAHMQDPTTLEGKPCTITLTMSVTPSRNRDQFQISVAGAAKFSGRESADSTIFATAKKDGSFEIVEFNPQVEMDFNQI